MSIQNYLIKTREWFKRNQADIALMIGFLLVTLVAFGAGRLTAPEIIRNPILIEEPGVGAVSVNLYGNISQPAVNATGDGQRQVSEKGLFVASRGGTKYHWPWCSWGERIKLENQVWFKTEAEAQAAGYSPCACITSKAPAGYKK